MRGQEDEDACAVRSFIVCLLSAEVIRRIEVTAKASVALYLFGDKVGRLQIVAAARGTRGQDVEFPGGYSKEDFCLDVTIFAKFRSRWQEK